MKEKEKELFIKVSREWFDRPNYYTTEKQSDFLVSKFGIDNLYMSSLMQSRLTIDGDSRFTDTEIKVWFGEKRQDRIDEKLEGFRKMQEAGLLTVNTPYPKHYYITDIDDVFFPKTNYTTVTYEELEKIQLNTTRINNANLFIVLAFIKSFLGKDRLICYPSIELMVENTTLCNKAVANSITTLIDLKLIARINNGWNAASKKNFGYTYTLWSEDAEEILKSEYRRLRWTRKESE